MSYFSKKKTFTIFLLGLLKFLGLLDYSRKFISNLCKFMVCVYILHQHFWYLCVIPYYLHYGGYNGGLTIFFSNSNRNVCIKLFLYTPFPPPSPPPPPDPRVDGNDGDIIMNLEEDSTTSCILGFELFYTSLFSSFFLLSQQLIFLFAQL